MATATGTKMVNGRVSERSARKAARVLAGEGLTVSSFIRNSLEYIANTGIIPASGKNPEASNAGTDELARLVRELESRPMPGKKDFPGLSEDEIVEQLRMERYGY